MYYKRFENANINSLLKEAFTLSYINNKSWMHKTNKLIQLITDEMNIDTTQSSRKYIEKHLSNDYMIFWKNKLLSQSKMRTYIQFKGTFCYENYLDELKLDHRKSIARLRTSAHHLPIERGRYNRPPLPLEERTCPYCPSEIGSELHFLTECTQYSTERKDLFKYITHLCPNFDTMHSNHKLIFLLNAEGEILKKTASFIHRNIP